MGGIGTVTTSNDSAARLVAGGDGLFLPHKTITMLVPHEIFVLQWYVGKLNASQQTVVAPFRISIYHAASASLASHVEKETIWRVLFPGH
ncbi:hypothetical protein KSF_048050 [Reticulibacter mediterranei]|uniref:Uncharacterized protein n=1 Tax=Reticulibacter mediterranei TaxID=2778369 RepID=A0A8J3N540_9CHLR|nr:hypothetical protein [Reticulibacter mediterranei]GHO94757.1 hypothetical protein KSF_048050 [Reticulibacter mediterranei]